MTNLNSEPIRECKKIEVIHAKVLIGKGVEGDPARILDCYFSLDGALLATYDSWENDQP